MIFNLAREVFYVSRTQALPQQFKNMSGIHWHWVQSEETLSKAIRSLPREKINDPVWIVVFTKYLSVSGYQLYSKYLKSVRKTQVIFFTNVVEKSVQQTIPKDDRIHILNGSQFQMIEALVEQSYLQKTQSSGRTTTEFLKSHEGAKVQNLENRRQERLPLSNTVILKKLKFDETMTESGVEFLKDGAMTDISKGGAQLQISKGLLTEKDFFVLIFQDQKGRWHTMDSQVRWMSSSITGQEVVGVQFIKQGA